MTTIYKYPIGQTGGARVEMPKGATIRAVAVQSMVPTIWAEVDPEAEREMRFFRFFGTGHPIDEDGLTFLGTAFDNALGLVWHIFEAES